MRALTSYRAVITYMIIAKNHAKPTHAKLKHLGNLQSARYIQLRSLFTLSIAFYIFPLQRKSCVPSVHEAISRPGGISDTTQC